MARRRISLNGTWSYILDQYRCGFDGQFWRDVNLERCRYHRPSDHSLDGQPSITVPGSWNMQVRELHYYDGLLWYIRRFRAPRLKKRQRLVLRFEAAYYQANVFLNGEEIGSHSGGFTPFEMDITSRTRKNNVLVVGVDASRQPQRVPAVQTDWFTYGGLTRDVLLEIRPAAFIRDFFIYLQRPDRIAGRIEVSNAGAGLHTARLECPELGVRIDVPIDEKRRKGVFRFKASPQLWSPENPKLYEITVSFGKDRITERVGFRMLAVRDGQILLNGNPIRLKGVSVHEDHYLRGRTLTDADRKQIFAHARKLGLNMLRLAHYPHSRRMAEMADELGFILWEEIPVYWHIDWESRQAYREAASQLRELITRDRNRCSVGFWSVGNETPIRARGRLRFMTGLARLAKRLDRSRLVTAATFISDDDGKIRVEDPLAAELDVIGVNQYGGWYEPDAGAMRRFRNDCFPDKPVIVSEFGAGAKAGLRGDFKFTEDVQARIYRKQLQALRQAKGICGMTPWVLYDFRTPARQNKYQRGFNLKGLVDKDRRREKMAFEVYRGFHW